MKRPKKWKQVENTAKGLKQYQYQCRECTEQKVETIIKAVIREPELRKGKRKGPRKDRITVVCSMDHRHRAGWLTHK